MENKKAEKIIDKYRKISDEKKAVREKEDKAREERNNLEKNRLEADQNFIRETIGILKDITNSFTSAHYTKYEFKFESHRVSIGYRNGGLVQRRGRTRTRYTADSYHWLHYGYDVDARKFKFEENQNSGIASDPSTLGTLAFMFGGRPRVTSSERYFDNVDELLGHYESTLERIKSQI
jgi:hypothetical protein